MKRYRQMPRPAIQREDQYANITSLVDEAPIVVPKRSARRNSFVGYERTLTGRGGFEIVYRDQLANAFTDFLRPCLAWGGTAWVGWEVFFNSEPEWPKSAVILVVGVGLVWLVAYWKIYVRHRLEVHPEGLFVDEEYFFGLDEMGDNRLTLEVIDGNPERFEVTGIVGTRQVRFATANRIDEKDRTPERLRQDLVLAMEQLWDRREAMVPSGEY